jgi:tyrosine-protein phosphatase YwqE
MNAGAFKLTLGKKMNKISIKIIENQKLTSELLDISDDMTSNINNLTPQSFDMFKEARKTFKRNIQTIIENDQYILEKIKSFND